MKRGTLVHIGDPFLSNSVFIFEFSLPCSDLNCGTDDGRMAFLRQLPGAVGGAPDVDACSYGHAVWEKMQELGLVGSNNWVLTIRTDELVEVA